LLSPYLKDSYGLITEVLIGDIVEKSDASYRIRKNSELVSEYRHWIYICNRHKRGTP